ncbi:MAG: TetR/AcrR family transcriptional regulator [Spirochaetaceae bacterium]|nr:MAG: TetR/AcrR family transcriptional regulator [Spirochaetaceae bacterium]
MDRTAETYHHGDLRNALIREGLRMLNREGPAGFSLRRLSRELGVSHAAAYRHFRRREELLEAIVREAGSRFAAALEESVYPEATGEEALMQLGIGYVRFFLRNREVLPLFSVLPGGDSLLASFVRPVDPESPDTPMGFARFREIALRMHSEARFRHLTEGELLLGYWAKVHGLATILVTNPAFLPEEELERSLERVVRTAF